MTHVDKLLAEAEAQLQASHTFAKAVQADAPDDDTPPGSDMDGDLQGLDEATAQSDAAAETSDTEDASTEPPEDTDTPDATPAPMAKAATSAMVEYDAGALLTGISAHLTSIHEQLAEVREDNVALRRQNATLAKAIQAQGQYMSTMAKAQTAAMHQTLNLPTLPPSRASRAAGRTEVAVPTRVEAPVAPQGQPTNAVRAERIMAKAQQAVNDGKIQSLHISYYNELLRSVPVDEALAMLSPDERLLLSDQ